MKNYFSSQCKILFTCCTIFIISAHQQLLALPLSYPIQIDTFLISKKDTSRFVTYTVGRIIIIGNKKTTDRIILRELSLKTTDTILESHLEKIIKRDKLKIYNLRLFNTVSIRAVEIQENIIDLIVEVSERWYLLPIPIFELSDRNFNEWWQNYNHTLNRVNYGLRLYQNNFRGRNETIKLTTQFGFSRKFDLSYRIPYLDKKQKQGLQIDADFSEPKNIAYYTENHKLKFQPCFL